MQTATAANSKGTGRRNGITQILVDRIDGDLVRKVASKLGVEIEDGASDDRAATALHAHFLESQEELFACSGDLGCGGSSPVSVGAQCPFCGRRDEALPEGAPAPVAATPKAEKPKKEPAPKKAPAAPAAPVAAAAPPAANGHANGKNGASMALATVPKAVPLAKTAAAATGELLTVGALDAKVAEYQRAKQDAVNSYARVASVIAELMEGRLWSLRLDEKTGKQRFLNFDAFCSQELNMAPNTARKMAAASKVFTPADIARLGSKRIDLLLQAAPEDRPKIRQKTGDSAPVREMEREVRKANQERRERGEAPTPDRDGKLRASSAREPKIATAKQITVQNILGTETVKLFKAPAPKVWDEKAMKRAKTLGDDPVGRLELANGVTMTFQVTKTSTGELTLKVKTERVKG